MIKRFRASFQTYQLFENVQCFHFVKIALGNRISFDTCRTKIFEEKESKNL